MDREVPGTSIENEYASIIPRYPELAGQIAIVTGSGRGIGKGIALRLAREGMKVVITGLDPGEVETTAGQLAELGAEVLAVPGDLGLTEEVNRLFRETIETFGTVDLLVNNAADLLRFHFFEVSEELLDSQLASNIRGPYLCAVRTAEIMRDGGRGGNIIHLSSVGGIRAHRRGLPYDLTKGAIDAMTRAMALELADYGIRVNAVAPGAIPVGKAPRNQDPARVKEIVGRIPLARFGTPRDIASVVAFLASPEAGYITGQVIYVDGGLVAQLSPRGQDI